MMARKPRSRSSTLGPSVVAGAVFDFSSGGSARLTSAPTAAVPAMTQIRFLAAMTSTSTPQTSAPTTKAADPHSRNGP